MLADSLRELKLKGEYMNINDVFFAYCEMSEKTHTIDNLLSDVKELGKWKVVGAVLNPELTIYDRNFNPVNKDELREAILFSHEKPKGYICDFYIFWQNNGSKKRCRGHYFRHVRTFQERKLVGARNASNIELKELGFHKKLKARRSTLPSEYDDIRHAEKGRGWKNYRKKQYK